MTKQAKFFFVPPEDTIADEFTGIPRLGLVNPDAPANEWEQSPDSRRNDALIQQISDRQSVFGF
jgi:hypothetical protein